MKRLHIVPSIFLGGPAGLVAAGLLGHFMPSIQALAVGMVIGAAAGYLVIREICRPTV